MNDMRTPQRLRRIVPRFLVLAGLFLPFPGLIRAQAPAQPSDSPATKLNALAHLVMESGIKSNALGGDLKPWHIKADFQVLLPGTTKPVAGTMEEWHTSPTIWKRTYTSAHAAFNGSEWGVSRTERYQSRPGPDGFDRKLLSLRVARPVLDPLYQAGNIRPDYEMQIKRANTGGITLNCVSVKDPDRYADQTNPDRLFPTMCFEQNLHLRLTVAADTTLQMEDLQPFAERTLARDIKVIVKGNLLAEMKVRVLEPLADGTADAMKPARDAIPEPYTIEPGFPMPEPVYEVGAAMPLMPNGMPYRGFVLVPVLIHKDGSVRVQHEQSFGGRDELLDALEIAVNKWRFKPYLAEGKPVEVATVIAYDLEAKPFVPSYERAARKATVAPPAR